MQCNEIWKDIVGYEPYYQISDQGRVRSKVNDKILSQHKNNKGYWMVNLCFKKPRVVSVHRLLLFAFVGPCPDGMQAAHLDGKRDHCALNNLRWVTPLENAAHRHIHKTQLFGDTSPTAKLSCEKVKILRAFREIFPNTRNADLATYFGVSRRTIDRAIIGKYWAHIQ